MFISFECLFIGSKIELLMIDKMYFRNDSVYCSYVKKSCPKLDINFERKCVFLKARYINKIKSVSFVRVERKL